MKLGPIPKCSGSESECSLSMEDWVLGNRYAALGVAAEANSHTLAKLP